jgi:hypothetical protein
MSSYEKLLERWESRRHEWLRLGSLVSGAAIAEEVLVDLQSLISMESTRQLTIAEAAELSGYSVDHLRRLISECKLRNVGRKGAPRLLLSELPTRPTRKVDSSAKRTYDPSTDARSLRVRR